MKMEVDLMIRKFLIAAAGVAGTACAAVTVQAQGYFDFSDVPGIDSEPTVQIDLTPEMLGFMTAVAGESAGTEAGNLLAGIEGVRVRVYEDVRDQRAVTRFIDEASRRLEAAGWNRAVYIADDEDRVRMYMRFENNEVSGMTVMVSSDDEAVFVNIAGTINPATLGQVARTMGLDGVLNSVGGTAALSGRPPGAGPGASAQSGENDSASAADSD
jgi:hypothetical protein